MSTLDEVLAGEQRAYRRKQAVEQIVGRTISAADWKRALAECGGERQFNVKQVADRMQKMLRDRKEAVPLVSAPPPEVLAEKITTSEKVACPFCGNNESKVTKTVGNVRYRLCKNGCGRSFRTTELADF